MSYILDALRKSDQERRLGAAPTLHSAQLTAVSTERRAPWAYAVVAVLLAGAAFALGWIRPWQAQPRGVEASVSPRSFSPETNPMSQDGRASSAMPKAPSWQSPAIPTSRESAARAAMESRQPAQEPKETAESLRETARAEPERAVEGATENRVVSFTDLPPAVRQQIPALTISVHAYSRTPKDRLVGINDRLLREGDTLGSDLVLEKITPDGMILSFKGTRFRRSVQ